MRPVPASKHVFAIVTFLLVAGLFGFLSWYDDNLSDEQLNLAAAAAKRHQPDLMQYDTVYGDVNVNGELRKLHTPVFLALMDTILIPTGYRDMMLPFRVLTGPMVFLYLCGMYGLLWRQCRSSSTAAFVAVLSSTITHTFGNWFWGIGSLASISPQGLVIAVSPLIVLGYLKTARSHKIFLTFGALGICANIHLISAANLALILVLVYMVRNSFRPRAILTGLGGLVCFTIGALPYLMYFLTLRSNIAADFSGDFPVEGVIRALRISELTVLYPELFHNLLRWSLYAGVLLVLSGVVLWRFHRFRAQDMDVWIWTIIMGLLVALLLHGASQFIGMLLQTDPPYIDFIQAACWVMLPLYVLLAQALTHIFRIVYRGRHYIRWACGALMIAWMLPSDNLRPLRHGMYYAATMFLDESHKPIRVLELKDRSKKDSELKSLADWARQNTDPQAVFVTDQPVFRMQARRSIYVCREDGRHFYYLAPWMLSEWTDQVLLQYHWLRNPVDEIVLITGVDELAASMKFQKVPEWYVLLSAKTGQKKFNRLRPIESEKWGQYWQIYQIPSHQDGTK